MGKEAQAEVVSVISLLRPESHLQTPFTSTHTKRRLTYDCCWKVKKDVEGSTDVIKRL